MVGANNRVHRLHLNFPMNAIEYLSSRLTELFIAHQIVEWQFMHQMRALQSMIVVVRHVVAAIVGVVVQ